MSAFDKEQAVRIEQQITLQYRFAAGYHASRFFAALRDEGRILATRDTDGNVMVPPRPVCGLSSLPMDEWVEVGPGGTLAGCTVVYVPFVDPMTGVQRPVPYGFGLVRFDGADTRSITCSTRPTRPGSGSANGWRPCSNRGRSGWGAWPTSATSGWWSKRVWTR